MHAAVDITEQSQIEAELRNLVHGFRSHVVSISFDFGRDWSGDAAIFFHVVLADSSTRGVMLGRVTAEVRKRLTEMLRRLNLRLIGYSDFRSESELLQFKRS